MAQDTPERLSGSRSMRVDGNVLAGMMEGLFAEDPTMLVVTCRGCGAVSALAEVVVEIDEMCGIALCRSCSHTLFTVMREDGGVRIVFGGLASLSA